MSDEATSSTAGGYRIQRVAVPHTRPGDVPAQIAVAMAEAANKGATHVTVNLRTWETEAHVTIYKRRCKP